MSAPAVVRSVDLAEHARNAPSFFADPVAWLVCAAVDRAVDGYPGAAALAAAPEQVGVIVVSGTGTAVTAGRLAASAARGAVSPLRFAGANPGVLAGLPCIRGGFRGPALTLAMPPAHGLAYAGVAARAWLRDGQADHVLVAVHLVEDGAHVVRCAVTAVVSNDDRELTSLLGGDAE